jgi:hypothetical protein
MANDRIYPQTTSQGRLFKGLLHAVKITNFGSKMVYNHFMVSVSVWMAWSKHAGNVARVKKSARNTSRRRVILRAFLNREGTLNFRVWMAWSKPRFRPIRARVIYMLFYNYFSRVLCKYIQNSRTSQGYIYFPHFILQHFATKPFNFTHFEMSFPGCLFPIVSYSLPIIDRWSVVISSFVLIKNFELILISNY